MKLANLTILKKTCIKLKEPMTIKSHSTWLLLLSNLFPPCTEESSSSLKISHSDTQESLLASGKKLVLTEKTFGAFSESTSLKKLSNLCTAHPRLPGTNTKKWFRHLKSFIRHSVFHTKSLRSFLELLTMQQLWNTTSKLGSQATTLSEN